MPFQSNNKLIARLLNIANKTFKVLRANLISDPWKKKMFYLSNEFPGEITIVADGIRFEVLKITLQDNSFPFVLEGYGVLREICFGRTATFSVLEKQFLMHLDGLILNPTTAEELFIIHEVFIRGTYTFDLTDHYHVIDIGMNVGFASLFFASLANVDKVFAFEPLQPTFQQAEINLRLNERFSNKIAAVNYGLSDRSETLLVEYDYSNKGQVGIQGTANVRSALQKVEKQSIILKKASIELKKILDQFAHSTFILKVDCEGSEYSILQDLFAHDLLSRFKIVVIEWHELGPKPLIDLLRQSKFVCFYQNASPQVGMIYASR